MQKWVVVLRFFFGRKARIEGVDARCSLVVARLQPCPGSGIFAKPSMFGHQER